MLNGYAFQKRLEEYKSQEDSKQKCSTLKQRHEKNRDEQSDNYKHRVERFIRDMIDNPIPIKNYQPNDNQFRHKEDRTKMLGDALIRTKSFVTEKIRIQQTIEHYKNILDTESTQNMKIVHEFRERDITKEIQPKMRFTAATQIERVIDAISNNRNSCEYTKQTGLRRSLSSLATEQIQYSLMNSLQGAKKNKENVLSPPPPARRNLDDSVNEEVKDKKKEPVGVDSLFASPITRKGKLLTFYSTNSSHRMRVAVSQFMLQNMLIAKSLNKDHKKLHFQAAQSVELQHPGTLQNYQQSLVPGSQNSSPRKGGESKDVAYSILNTSKNFYKQPDDLQASQMKTSKSAFFLPLNKSTRGQNKDNTMELSQTYTKNFTSHFQLPNIQNPLLVSKEKQKKMASYLEYKSQNPYEVKKRKQNIHSKDQQQKVETLMATSYLDSPFYSTFYKNSQNNNSVSTKQLRFNMKPTDLEEGQTTQASADIKPELSILKTIANGAQADKFTLKSLHNVKQLVNNRDKIEHAALEILHSCNAVVDSSHTTEKMLKKGEGRTIGGDGHSNYQVYSDLLKTM